MRREFFYRLSPGWREFWMAMGLLVLTVPPIVLALASL